MLLCFFFKRGKKATLLHSNTPPSFVVRKGKIENINLFLISAAILAR